MKSKKIVAIAMAIILVVAITVPAVIATNNEPAPMKLVYDEPATQKGSWNDGLIRENAETWESRTLPIGNGKLAGMVYGELDNEILAVNEETLWGGGRGSVQNYNGGNADRPVASKYKELADYYVNGTSTSHKVEELIGAVRENSGYDDGYLPLGNLKFSQLGHTDAINYRRELSLDDAIATVTYENNGTKYTREYFANHDSNVIVVKFTANKNNAISFDTTFAVSGDLSSTFKTSVSGNTGYITCRGKIDKSVGKGHNGNGLLHNTQIAVVANGAEPTVNSNGISVNKADEVTVYLTAATDYKNTFKDKDNTIEYYYRTGETADELEARVKRVLDNAVNKGYESVKRTHLNDYHNLYNRVNLDLGQQSTNLFTDDLLTNYRNNKLSAGEQRYLEVLLFQYGRYLLISSSREDSQIPANLQGIWNGKTNVDWNSDLHTNINLQMNYWLSGNCNLTECAKPLVQYMADLKEPGRKTVEIYTGAQHGIMAHTQNTPFGYTAPGWEIDWGWSPAAATWLMQNCYDYYQYSQDKATLKNTIYPMLKEQVLMYEDLLMEKDGRKVMPITYSPEIGPTSAGNTYEQSLIAQLYKDTIEAAKILGDDSNVISKWQATYDKLDPIQIGTSGQIKEWANETNINSVVDTSDHRHLSNLLGLFPGDIVDTPEEIAAAKVSLNNKKFGKVGTENKSINGGWTYGQMINSWARVGDGDNAYFCVSQLIKQRLFENLWDFHAPAIFQIDGNFGYSAGVAEMLLQSNLGYIKFIPAISKQWAKGSVSGLLAQGNFEIGIDWANQEVTKATIKAKNAGECKFENPFKDRKLKLVDSKGNDVQYTELNGICTFTAKANETYTVKQAPKLNLSGSRTSDGKEITITWDFDPEVKYKIYRTRIN